MLDSKWQIHATRHSTLFVSPPPPPPVTHCSSTRPDNLVPALKKVYFWALFSAQQKSHYFEH